MIKNIFFLLNFEYLQKLTVPQWSKKSMYSDWLYVAGREHIEAAKLVVTGNLCALASSVIYRTRPKLHTDCRSCITLRSTLVCWWASSYPEKKLSELCLLLKFPVNTLMYWLLLSVVNSVELQIKICPQYTRRLNRSEFRLRLEKRRPLVKVNMIILRHRYFPVKMP